LTHCVSNTFTINTHPVGHNRKIARLQREIFPGGRLPLKFRLIIGRRCPICGNKTLPPAKKRNYCEKSLLMMSPAF
jgi:hypothetical protein